MQSSCSNKKEDAKSYFVDNHKRHFQKINQCKKKFFFYEDNQFDFLNNFFKFSKNSMNGFAFFSSFWVGDGCELNSLGSDVASF